MLILLLRLEIRHGQRFGLAVEGDPQQIMVKDVMGSSVPRALRFIGMRERFSGGWGRSHTSSLPHIVENVKSVVRPVESEVVVGGGEADRNTGVAETH